MTRMSREFSLVLLGAGVLTAGYFMWPEQDFQKRADEQAARRVGGQPTRTGGHVLVFIHSSGGSHSVTGTRSAAMASVSRGGFGAIGGRVSGGGGGGG
jgi:hypothetical protein